VAGFRLTEDEAWDAVARAHTSVYTTLRKDGRPIALPIWHVVIDRAIYLRTPGRSKKLARIRNDPRGHFLVEFGHAWAELAAVSFPVTATIIDDPRLTGEVRAAIDRKYAAWAAPEDLLPAAIRATYANMVAVRLDPDGRLSSWNNRALLGDDSDPVDAVE
jgi:hypothetical protein